MNEYLHDVSTLRVSQSVDGFALSNDANSNASSHCDVGQRFLRGVLAQFELGVCCSIDISIDATLSLSESLLYGL